jgi:hypothetical protein
MFAGPQWPNAKRPNASVTLQTTYVRRFVPFVPLHTLAGSVHTTDVQLQTPCVPLQTTIVTVQTGVAGQQTAIAALVAAGLDTLSSFSTGSYATKAQSSVVM